MAWLKREPALRRYVRHHWLLSAIVGPVTAFGLAIVLLVGSATAQWPPENTVRIIVPFAAGGTGDVLIRLLAQEVSNKTNRTILVENRPGGGAVIGTAGVARSPADGSTLLLVATSFIINASLRKDLPYDPLTSFEPICLLAHSPFVLAVNSKSEYRSLSQFIAAARDPQSQISIGGTGPNTAQHIAIEKLKQVSNVHLRFVPFSGDPPAVNNLLGGHITAVLANYAGVKEHLGAALRPLAVGSDSRLAEFPDVPTFSEGGFAGLDTVAWVGLVLPANPPERMAAQIAAHFRSALEAPRVKAEFEALALTPVGLCGRDFGAFLFEQQARIARTVKATKMKGE